jgi:uncharacterized protein (DUF927 family)
MAKPQGRARCVPTLGWHDNAYLRPDETIGHSDERLICQAATPHNHNFRLEGSLEGWQNEIGKYADGNWRLIFAISMAFAAVLLHPLGVESGGVHFCGASSIGKTALADVAGSVCGGGPEGYKRAWRVTDNALEAIASLHNDNLLVLDEVGQTDSEVLSRIIYMLANGFGKGRMSRDIRVRAAFFWRVLFLSTGEIALTDKMLDAKRGRRATAGQEVRFLNVPSDAGVGYGVFDTVHGFTNAQALVDYLKSACRRNYGHPQRAFSSAPGRRKLAADGSHLHRPLHPGVRSS